MAFGVLIVAWTKLLATLLDTELFHFEGPDFLPAFAAWAWLGVYIVIPVGLAILIVIQLRMEGEDPPKGPSLPTILKAAFLTISAVMLAIGAIQLVAADTAIDIWPWPLTPLTSHALSAWFLGVGVLAALTVWENDLQRSHLPRLGCPRPAAGGGARPLRLGHRVGRAGCLGALRPDRPGDRHRDLRTRTRTGRQLGCRPVDDEDPGSNHRDSTAGARGGPARHRRPDNRRPRPGASPPRTSSWSPTTGRAPRT